jgi:uncharacterized protein YcbK (DUF882 family)
MGDLTPHFSAAEFESKDGAPSPAPTLRLLGVLENLRGQIRQPIHIVSGYRSPEHNAAVGGAEHSQHLDANAADLQPGWCTVEMALEAGATGIGISGDWVIHVDARDGEVTTWVY